VTGRSQRRRAQPERPRVLIIVQNLSVPFDRRVWLECQSLIRAGFDVTVVCPRDDHEPVSRVLDGVTILSYPGFAPGGSAAGYLAEYAYSLAATSILAFVGRRRGRYDVVQACNPPDIFFPLARWFQLRDGSRFVFDHHDLCPELYESRFPGSASLLLKGLLFLERSTFRTADHVISTNESYAAIATGRGGKSSDEVTVVRTGPDPERLRRGAPDPSLRRGRRYLVAYLGVMGPQDGVDNVVAAADRVVNGMGRTDISFTLMGSGDCFDELVAQRDRLGLHDYVEFMGRVPDETVVSVLSTADIGLCPDPKNPLNDVSTMNKVMEYMAFQLPVLAFDLRETRVSAGKAASYVEPNLVDRYAQAMVDLVGNPDLRAEMGRRGRERVERELAWSHQQNGYVAAFNRLVGRIIVLPDADHVVSAPPDGAVDAIDADVAAEAGG
jgi:glycosyltransferase involved in cell wall biosynthesis